jgi:hypothetical protein
VRIGNASDAPFDVTKKSAGDLVVEGTNLGTGTVSAISIQNLGSSRAPGLRA